MTTETQPATASTQKLPRTLTRDLAEGVSRYLRLPLVARWRIVEPEVAPGQGTANSAQRVAAVWRATRPLTDWIDDHVGAPEHRR